MEAFALATFCLLVTSCEAAREDPCTERLPTPRGGFGFPAEEENEECGSWSWSIRLKKKQSLRIIFRTVDLRDSVIKIQSKRLARDDYGTLLVVEEGREVIIEPPRKFVRIVMEGLDGNFRAAYEVFYCALPPPMLAVGECTNYGYRKYAKCLFKCESKAGFFPRNPEAINIGAKCRGNQMWSEDFESKCIELPEFEDICFDGTSKCPFNNHQLEEVFHEKMDLKEYLPVVVPDVPDSASDATVAKETFMSSRDVVDLVCGSVQACEESVPKCGQHPVRQFIEPCFICRHILKVCPHLLEEDATQKEVLVD